MRELRSMLVDDFLSSKTFSAGIYVGSRIKPEVLKIVSQSMDIPREDIIKVVIDGTHFGSAKNGFVISADGLYWKEFWGSPQFTNWQALSIAQANKQITCTKDSITIQNAKIAMTFGYYAAKDLENIINGVLYAFHSMATEQVNDAGKGQKIVR